MEMPSGPSKFLWIAVAAAIALGAWNAEELFVLATETSSITTSLEYIKENVDKLVGNVDDLKDEVDTIDRRVYQICQIIEDCKV